MTRGWSVSIQPKNGATAGDELRIGDAERQSAASALGDHVSAGRLSWDEYDSRLQTVYAAKTRADLAPLFRDLPPLPPGPAPRPNLSARFANTVGVPLRLVALFAVLFVALFIASVLDFRHPGFLIPVAIFFWFGPLRHRHHGHHPRRRAVPATSSHWEPPRSR